MHYHIPDVIHTQIRNINASLSLARRIRQAMASAPRGASLEVDAIVDHLLLRRALAFFSCRQAESAPRRYLETVDRVYEAGSPFAGPSMCTEVSR